MSTTHITSNACICTLFLSYCMLGNSAACRDFSCIHAHFDTTWMGAVVFWFVRCLVCQTCGSCLCNLTASQPNKKQEHSCRIMPMLKSRPCQPEERESWEHWFAVESVDSANCLAMWLPFKSGVTLLFMFCLRLPVSRAPSLGARPCCHWRAFLNSRDPLVLCLRIVSSCS